MRRVGFRPAASADLVAAHSWYEAQRAGLGEEFLAAVDAGITSILDFPEAQPEIHRGARRFLLERFPYVLYYRLSKDLVMVVACLHAARDPRAWRSRLDG